MKTSWTTAELESGLPVVDGRGDTVVEMGALLVKDTSKVDSGTKVVVDIEDEAELELDVRELVTLVEVGRELVFCE